MKLIEMTAEDVRQISESSVALLPLAAIEQHGPHLPVSTDTAITTALAEQAEARLSEHIVLCPTQCYGASHHHLAFGGTLSLSVELYTQVIGELVECLLDSGFTRIVLLNGHGGNVVPIKQALTSLGHALHDVEPRPLIATVTYWEIGGPLFAGAAPMQTPGISHACEYETSMMLHLYPDRVHMDRIQPRQCPPSNEYLSWDGGPSHGVSMPLSFDCITNTGNLGKPELATPAKGEQLVAGTVEALCRFLQSFRTWPLIQSMVQGSSS